MSTANKLKSGQWLAFFIDILPFLTIIGMAIIFFFGKKHEELDYKQNPDYPKSNISSAIANSLAKQLYEAMRYFGTDEASIINVFAQINENGALLVFNKFGIRQYSQTIGLSAHLNLTEWLRSELDETDSAYVEAYLKLAPNGLL